MAEIDCYHSVSNEKNFGPKFPKNRNKIEVSVSAKIKKNLFTFILMPKFINFYLLFHSNQSVMTRKLLYFA